MEAQLFQILRELKTQPTPLNAKGPNLYQANISHTITPPLPPPLPAWTVYTKHALYFDIFKPYSGHTIRM